MKKILTLLAKQIVVSDTLSRLYALRAQQIAGQHASTHQRDYHHGSYDVELALKYERELQEKISKKHAEFESNQDQLVKLIEQLDLVPA